MSRARFLRSEVALVFRRRRNLALLGVLAAVPIVIAITVKLTGTVRGSSAIFRGVTDNALFTAFASLLVTVPVFLPLVVAVVAGDAIAGEAGNGTLRYLLTVPVSRARLLAVKTAAVLTWCSACVVAVVVAGLLAGSVLFPSGALTLLSGREASYGSGILRLLTASGYVAAVITIVGALGLFASTLTDTAVAAMAATLTLVVVSEVADAVPQLGAVHNWLPSHYWLQWIDVLRDPIPSGRIVKGLVLNLGYAAVFASAAWARFADKDVTS